jgi:Acyl-CoA dehydrogenase, C-terminal domain/Acyl-CoA dehydrogenase, N-terminal domain
VTVAATPQPGFKRTLFTPEQDAFREAVRAFLVSEALPHTDRWEADGMVARRWRDARVQRIYGGTNEILREIVGRALGV